MRTFYKYLLGGAAASVDILSAPSTKSHSLCHMSKLPKFPLGANNGEHQTRLLMPSQPQVLNNGWAFSFYSKPDLSLHQLFKVKPKGTTMLQSHSCTCKSVTCCETSSPHLAATALQNSSRSSLSLKTKILWCQNY